ncbi:DDE-type integrase/transposase/recombinase [Bradyrhizobium vignae]|uniref:DDE-type integrase/transposase/recombinase n=1 Tax=Bradyrhizobium vignae TaxID=1549949 RepID=UPI00100C0D69|nr:DDE-type integrase/transposase/recombinase [Bradyrhizobium vignae]RXG91880.1 transposase [Bradyrhizobium vignae]
MCRSASAFYRLAIIDWTSRAMLAWRLSKTTDASFCVSALEEALARFGRPEIFNTDQVSQFTSAAFTARWPQLLKGYSDGHEAKAGIARWIEFYNCQRAIRRWKTAPMAVWRADVTGAFGEEAVDMMLLASEKLGQRCALPTSPQPQQQQARVV